MGQQSPGGGTAAPREGWFGMSGITIVNFTHPLTALQLDSITKMTGLEIERVIDVATHFDTEQPFAAQAQGVVAAAGMSAKAWQTMPLLVNLPALSPIAAVVLALLHGITGHFPSVLRLRPVKGATLATFEVAEILNLNDLRNEARSANT
jgi:hypothetical protein